jgi:AraC family transcriptional regulator of adaptative response/methylated-DNA-[protein]-cysteine methyltransferase
MKAPKILFRDEAPKVVLWGLHKIPSGNLMIGITLAGAVCRTAFAASKKPAAILSAWQQEWPGTEFIKDEKKTAPIAKKIVTAKAMPTVQMTGTKFQQQVWKGLLGIPSGTTISYGTLAKRIKNPKAARAVGSACGANPVPLLVPCHRVIANDGGLGGFSSGLAVKKVLLKLEAK